MKVIKVAELPPVTPPKHYNMHVKRAVDESIGSKTMKVSFGHLERNGEVESHIHENEEQLFIVLKGAMKMKSGDKEFKLKKDDAILFFPGEPHANSADGVETDYLCITGLNLPPAGAKIPEKRWKAK
jgi:quercetin dioxygenase-like cupin family protein